MTAPQIRDPHEWMREQERRTAELVAKAEQAKAALAENTVTQVSPDGLVRLQVNPGGALTSLEISQQAEKVQMARLAGIILATYAQATSAAAARTVEIMSELTGPSSDAVEFLKSTLPQPTDDDSAAPPPAPPPAGQPRRPEPQPHPDDEVFDGIAWQTDATPSSPPAPPRPQPKPQRPAAGDDDFGPADWRS